MKEEFIKSLEIAKYILDSRIARDETLSNTDEENYDKAIIQVIEDILQLLSFNGFKDFLEKTALGEVSDLDQKMEQIIKGIEKHEKNELEDLLGKNKRTFEKLFYRLHETMGEFFSSDEQLTQKEQKLAEARRMKGELFLLQGKEKKALKQIKRANQLCSKKISL